MSLVLILAQNRTVSSSNKISSGSVSIFGLRDNANGAKLQIGKASVSTTPTIDFRSSGQAPNYDVQMIVSGGNSTDGNGAIRLNASDFTVKGNTVWHAGNDGSASQLDAHYLDGYVQSTSATGNTIARRDASGHLTVNDLTADQGIFSNNGAGTLSLADGNGITLGKSTTNTLALKGKGSSSVGYVKFGNDSNAFGWNGTHLSYNNVYFRSGYIGIGESNPGAPLEIKRDGTALNLWAEFTTGGTNDGRIQFGTSGGSPQITFDDIANDVGWAIGVDDANVSWFCIKGFATPGSVGYLATQGSTGSCNLAIYQPTGRWFINKAGSTGSGSRINVGGTIETDSQLKSTVATGTAPLAVTSTTKVTNLNADLLDGYTALGLPYLGGSVNVWISDDGGQERFYFSNNSHTYFRTGSDFFFRNNVVINN